MKNFIYDFEIVPFNLLKFFNTQFFDTHPPSSRFIIVVTNFFIPIPISGVARNLAWGGGAVGQFCLKSLNNIEILYIKG